MSQYQTIEIEFRENGVATLWLARASKNNAFNAQMIRELLDALDAVAANPAVRFMLLRGRGKHFSAGADLAWMRDCAALDYNANLDDARELAQLMASLAQLKVPTLAVVQGAAFGGALGLISCCDMAIGAEDALFSLSEVRIGLLPAVISPYVTQAIGARATRRYALTAERFDGLRARELGLLAECYPAAGLEAALDQWVANLLQNGPQAMMATKALLQEVGLGEMSTPLRRYTEAAIARVRISPEGQEGRRVCRPSWKNANPTGARAMIESLLIANRGEIACRIMRTARELGIATVAVHSETDRDALHVRSADQAVNLGGARPSDSYLKVEAIIAAAKAAGANAIHPGYGFLSENADFARAVAAAGLIFVGPPASAIDAMGSKSAAKALMETAGVPLVPGYHGADQALETFRAEAAKIGYPVLLKAAAGGGGKGMKVVESEAELSEALSSAQREAQAAFGDARMLVEKYVLQPRHVEIQVFADQHGNAVYLAERDCSIQRRHQKVVEEAPAPGLSPELRRAMGEAAVTAARAIGYVGAGTVEFLLDARGEFFFMEMNTRLQVEHPVTELITGQDLVAWQLRVAQGQPLPLSQEQIVLRGHAIEVRLYAEDPEQDFLPASGELTLYREPAAGVGRRVDSGVVEGDRVSPFYDPMLSKLIAWGEDRETARRRLLAMLAEQQLGGVHSNLAFLRRVLAHPAFALPPSWTPVLSPVIPTSCCLHRPRCPTPSGRWRPAPGC